MEKLKMRTSDFTDENIKRIAELFPNCVTEDRDDKGNIKKSIDFDLLHQELSKNIVDGPQERYSLNWPGKREALLTANAPIAKTLRPCREESVDFDTTQNLFIEGDNLDALKLMQETYLGKIKMIYIDPPYNTGNDFIYEDDFAETSEEFLRKSNQKDEEGNRLVANTESNGRFHSDWLSMMYPRLKLARNLLREDGVIFISIDDNEVDNLKKICNEVFGEGNFVSNFVWHNNVKGRQMDLHIKNTYESILVYSKSFENLSVNTSKESVSIENLEKDEISYFKKDYPLHNGTSAFHINNRPNLAYSIYYSPTTKDVKVLDEKKRENNRFIIGEPNDEGLNLIGLGYVRIIPKYNTTYNNQRVWRWGKEKFLREYKTELIFIKEGAGFYIYQKKRFKDGIHEKMFKNYINIDGGIAKKELFDILGIKIFENPKPILLINHLINIALSNDGIILDFSLGQQQQPMQSCN